MLCFAPAITLAQPSFVLDSTKTIPGSTGGFMAAPDLNNDGMPDLFATWGTALNRGNGRFGDFAIGGSPVERQSAVGDVDGNGFVDFVFPDFSAQTITFATNDSGRLVTGQSMSLAGLIPLPIFPTAVSAGDVNGDGSVDLAVASRQPLGPLIVLTNSGTGTFAPLFVTTNGLFGPVTVRVADMNGDGRPDVLCGDLTGSMIVFTNGLGTNFVRSCVVSNFIGISTGGFRCIGDVADVNADGKPDLIWPSFNTNAPAINLLKVATNAGHGLLLPASSLNMGALVMNQPSAVVIASDFNLDGKIDCVFQSEPDDRFVVATNRGDGNFAVARVMVTTSNRVGIAVADFNADGKPDVVSGDRTGLLQVYLNTTVAAAPAIQIATSGTQANVVYWLGAPGQFELQFTTNVASTNWQVVTEGRPVTGLVLSNRAPEMFFRLQSK